MSPALISYLTRSGAFEAALAVSHRPMPPAERDRWEAELERLRAEVPEIERPGPRVFDRTPATAVRALAELLKPAKRC